MSPLEKMVDVESIYFDIIRQLEAEFPYLQYVPSSMFLEFHKIIKGEKEDLTESLQMRFGFSSFKIKHNKLTGTLRKDIGYLVRTFEVYNIEIITEYCFDDGVDISYEHHLGCKGATIQAEEIMTNFPIEGKYYELTLIFASQEVVAAIYRDIIRGIDNKFNELKRRIETGSLRTEVTQRIRELIDIAVEKEFRENIIKC